MTNNIYKAHSNVLKRFHINVFHKVDALMLLFTFSLIQEENAVG